MMIILINNMIVVYLVFFTACALWQEYLYLRSNKFVLERSLLLVGFISMCLIKIPFVRSMLSSIDTYFLWNSAILGLIIAFMYDLFLRKIMVFKTYSDKVLRTQHRLLVKLPLLGGFAGATIYRYLGMQYVYIVFLALILILVVLFYYYLKKSFSNYYGFLFAAFGITSFVIKFINHEIMNSYLGLISDVAISGSIMILFIIHGRKDIHTC